jgi:hypothetical protein
MELLIKAASDNNRRNQGRMNHTKLTADRLL